MSGPDSNFLPNIKCPHCKANLVTSLSGFSGELSFREKICYRCKKPYFLQVYVTTTIEKSVTDGVINAMKDRIKFLKEQRKKTLTQVHIEHKQAEKFLEEADQMAAEMYRKRQMN